MPSAEAFAAVRLIEIDRRPDGDDARGVHRGLRPVVVHLDVIEAARRAVDIPVLKPNEAMFDEALEIGPRLALISTFQPSIPSMVRELEEGAARRKATIAVRTYTVAGAMEALQQGDGVRHDALIAESGAQFADCDVIMLAQFSMARAAAGMKVRPGQRVLTSPLSAVARLKRELA